MENRYFIINLNDPNRDIIFSYAVEDLSACRCNNDETKTVIKLHKGDSKNYPELASYTEYDLSGIREKMQGSEWINDEP